MDLEGLAREWGRGGLAFALVYLGHPLACLGLAWHLVDLGVSRVFGLAVLSLFLARREESRQYYPLSFDYFLFLDG